MKLYILIETLAGWLEDLVQYSCSNCGHEWVTEPGMLTCPKCGKGE